MIDVQEMADGIAARSTREEGGCHIWQGATQSRGYGSIGRNYKTYLSHCIVWEANNGPTKKRVGHLCANKRCVKIEHLFSGTDKEISQNTIKRGLQPTGESHGKSKLTEADVMKIRYIAATTTLVAYSIAHYMDYPVSEFSIREVIDQKSWKHLPSVDEIKERMADG